MEQNEGISPVAGAESTDVKVSKDALLVAGAVVLGSFIIAGAIFAMSGKSVTAPAADKGAVAAQDNQAAEDTNTATTIDDDPVLGDKKKAKVAIVEFSDLECPFCKRFHEQTYDQLVKEYVTTGKAILVARDFPLSFHDPNATKEAALAECVGKEKGDKAYFDFSQSVYLNTQANGQGLPEGKLAELLRKVGANATSVNACATSDEAKQEIAKDMADGQKAGVQGTPSFIIGKLDDKGNVTGERVVGAVPFDTLKTTIDKYLK